MQRVVAGIDLHVGERVQVVVEPGQEAAFLSPLPLRRLPGLGPSTEARLASLGIATVGELASVPIEVLRRRLGEHAARSLHERAAGVDSAPVTVPERPKSVSREETFATDVARREVLHQQLRACAADVGRQLRQGHWSARTATLKLRYSDFSTHTRQLTWPSAQHGDSALAAAAIELFDACWTGAPVRLLGMGVSGVVDAAQLDLFDTAGLPREVRLDHTLDALRTRFGRAAPHRGTSRALRDLDFRGEDLRADGAPRDRDGRASDVEERAHELDYEDGATALDKHVDEEA